MKTTLLLAFLLWQTAPGNESPVAQPNAMRYERPIHIAAGPGQAGMQQTCAALDAQIFPHAAPSLADLRIFPSEAGSVKPHEIPYAITLSEAVTAETQPARVLNLGSNVDGSKGRGSQGGKITFDLEMPQRAYTDVTLNLDPAIHNFLATATVSGSDAQGGDKSTALGSFTLFDLSAQHLSRDTTLPLVESTFRYLHVALSLSPTPGADADSAASFVPAMVKGAEVPPSREAQILYTTVAETSSIRTIGRQSRATFQIAQRVPVERVSFQLAPDFKGNFSRNVRVEALAQPDTKSAEDVRPPLPEMVGGTIHRVHATEAGRPIRSEELGFPASLGADLQSPAKVEVILENGDDQPLPIASVRLEMRQRKVCFDAAAGDARLAVYYGDPKLAGPVYDYDRLFTVSDEPLVAELGAEALNPQFHARQAEAQPFTEKHPEVLWIALMVVIAALGVVALKSSRNAGL